jgi:hypothetical protein
MGAKLVITARQAFDPASVRPTGPAQQRPNGLVQRVRHELRPGSYAQLVMNFYRDPLAWFGLLVSMLILAYAGGAVMFVVHAVVLGELGPAIPPVTHWALDSTLGFVGLAPIVALILPLAAWAACPDGGTVRPAVYAGVGGLLFALGTAPGPIAHDLLVGRGTWLANQVTLLLGGTSVAGHAQPIELGSEALSIAMQVLVGVPTYVALVWVALRAVRAVTRTRTRQATRRATAVLAPVE